MTGPRQFGAAVWFIQLTDESTTRHGETVTDVPLRGRKLANTFTVSGPTRAIRDWQVVSGIAEAVDTFRADLVVLGFGRRRVGRHRSSNSIREQLSVLTDVPVMVAPRRPVLPVVRVPHPTPRHEPVGIPAIALGPAASEDLERDERLVRV